jgi:hypothetical protein
LQQLTVMTDIVRRERLGRPNYGPSDSMRLVAASRRFISRFFTSRSSTGLAYDPYDHEIRKDFAERLFRAHRDDHPLGSAERCRLILDIIQETFPVEALSHAYFENLDRLLEARPVRRTPGNIVIGIGSGRNGSTSLAEMLSTIEASCCTHENPPLICWSPEPEEVRFHMKRLERLAEHFAVVADVAHWWLNAVPELFARIPSARVIGVRREVESCVRSFLKIKGAGAGSCNHWVPYGNGIWSAERWDPTYPTYDVPEGAYDDPNGAKCKLVRRYVREYNSAMCALAIRWPTKIMMIKTEDLSDRTAQGTLYNFVGANGAFKTVRLNIGTTKDGRRFRDHHLI